MKPDSLIKRTQKFWLASLAYNGKAPAVMTTSVAIRHLGDAFDSLSPERPLFKQATDLQWDIIQGRYSRTPKGHQHG